MPTVDDQVAEGKTCLPGAWVPHYASAHVIKAAYRKLVKRWHPDLYAAGTSEHADATQMSMLINQAHSAIAHAPLRYTSDSAVFNRTPQRGDAPS
jgi:DnaJ-class molecular chaperone